VRGSLRTGTEGRWEGVKARVGAIIFIYLCGINLLDCNRPCASENFINSEQK
jgi:hypothetical protein